MDDIPGCVGVHCGESLVGRGDIFVHQCALAVAVLSWWAYSRAFHRTPPIDLGGLGVVRIRKPEGGREASQSDKILLLD